MSDAISDMMQAIRDGIDILPARELWRGLDALQAMREELDALIDDLPDGDTRVIIRIENQPQRLRLSSIKKMSEYVTTKETYGNPQ